METPEIGPKLNYYLSLHGLSIMEHLPIPSESNTLLSAASGSSSTKSTSNYGPYPISTVTHVSLTYDESTLSAKSERRLSSDEKLKRETIESIRLSSTMASMYKVDVDVAPVTKERVIKSLSKVKKPKKGSFVPSSSGTSIGSIEVKKIPTDDSMRIPSELFEKTPEQRSEASSIRSEKDV